MSSDKTASFMVRFTQKIFEDESGKNDVQWRGRISHVQGGDQQAFTDFQDALTFIQDHLADMTIEHTEHIAPEDQDNLLTKSFDMWKKIAKSAPQMVIDTIKDPAAQVANIQKQINNVREEVEHRISEPLATIKEIDSWRSATKSDFKMVLEQLSEVSNQVAALNKKVDTLSKSKKK